MSRHTQIRLTLTITLLAALTAACSVTSLGGSSSSGGGPGSFNLTDGTQGLSALSAYAEKLTIQFDGTAAGQASKWTQTYDFSSDGQGADWLLTVDSHGLPADQSTAGLLSGVIGGVAYSRAAAGAPCSAAAVQEASSAPPPLNPAGLLPQVLGAGQNGTESVNGIAASRYTFDERAIGAAAQAKASGEIWVANAGGALVKYILNVQGGEGYFGKGQSGTMSWDYELGDVNGTSALEPPSDCPAGMEAAPLPQGATGVLQQPGYTTFTTTMNLKDLASFYQQKLSASDWKDVNPLVASDLAMLQFDKGDQVLSMVLTSKQGVSTVRILLERSTQSASSPTAMPGPGPSAGGSGDASRRVSDALNLLLGTGQKSPALPSCHLEVKGTSLKPQGAYTLSADVQGASVHFHAQGAATGTLEGYIVGGKDYRSQNGSVSDASGQVRLAWLEWPLEPVTALATASLGASPAGTETVAGRPADKYILDTSKAPAGALSALKGLSQITAAQGTIWVDQQSGALLQLTLDYTGAGSAKGHVEITVSDVGGVTVTLP